MIFTKDDISTSNKQVVKLTKEFNIHYRYCIGSLIHLFSTRADLSFAVYKLAKFSVNPGKVQFEGLDHLLRYISDNNNLGLKYYANMNNAPVTDLLRQASIKTENHWMAFSGSSYKYCPATGRSTGAYINFLKVVPLTISHMLQDQLLNKVHKVSTMHHALQEWI